MEYVTQSSRSDSEVFLKILLHILVGLELEEPGLATVAKWLKLSPGLLAGTHISGLPTHQKITFVSPRMKSQSRFVQEMYILSSKRPYISFSLMLCFVMNDEQ